MVVIVQEARDVLWDVRRTSSGPDRDLPSHMSCLLGDVSVPPLETGPVESLDVVPRN